MRTVLHGLLAVFLAGAAFGANHIEAVGRQAERGRTSIAASPVLGDTAAPLVIIEFSDFHCPFCRKHTRDTLPALKREYIQPGKVLYVFRNFPLERSHPLAVRAAVAAECASRQGRFWEMHGRLFNAPRPVGPDGLEREAKAIRLELPRFRECLDGATAPDRVQQDVGEARRFGLNATPAFLLGVNEGGGTVRVLSRLRGAHPYSVFKEMLDEIAAHAARGGR